MIVIDASSLAKYILREDNWQEVRDKINEPTYSLDFVMIEVTSAIWKSNLSKENMPRTNPILRFEALEMACNELLHIDPFKDYIRDALKIGIVEKIAVYDAFYIAQALKYGKLLTSDEPQSKVAIRLGIETIFIK